MRITLLCTESLRTPACPGFGVSGDRKISCFDRFGRQREVGRELGLWGERVGAFERVQMRGVAGDRGGREAYFGGLIERVQMGMGGAGLGGIARVGGSFERVQMRIGGASPGGMTGRLARLNGFKWGVNPCFDSLLRARWTVPLSARRWSWGLGRPTARRYSWGSAFEPGRTGFGAAVWGVGDRTAGPFERVQMGDGLGMRSSGDACLGGSI